MIQPIDTHGFSKVQSRWRSLVSTGNWLTKPAVSLPEPVRRRSHLLAWLLLIILLLLLAAIFLVLGVNSPGSPRRTEYVGLILGLMVLIAFAYGLNRTGHYYTSAGVTVACAVFGPWGSMLLDPTILRGDFVPLTYVTLPILLSSILIRPSITIVLAVLQLAALALIPLFIPATASINWPSFLAFFFFTSVLSILASVIKKSDLAQIDRQTRLLVQSEARLREQSIRDHLTTLFNRRYLDETLEREVQRAARKEHPLGIIMLDIDHFKHINDTMGHAAGDQLLWELGRLLRKQVRLADIACRYGGEEFVLILPEASLDMTKERAEQLREKVKQLHLEYENQNLGNLTISLGVAVFPNHGSTGEEILKSADAALYRAKHTGRDRMVVANEVSIRP